MSNVDVIGQVEAIDLPEVLEAQLCARIDTGAKTSAIWASKVKEAAEGLHVVFFGNDSAHYTGKAHLFTEYAETVVASSNGIAQRRYKVRLTVVLNGRRIKAWFTLADRSQQVYPVLIGRNVLRGKFIVDVSRKSKTLHNLERERSKLLQRKLGE